MSDVNNEVVTLFASLCQFMWVQGEPLPLIYELEHDVYIRHGINLQCLQRLESWDLISMERAGYVKRKFGRHTRLFYFGRATKIQFPLQANNELDIGHVILTAKGKALAARIEGGIAPNLEFYEYIIEKWFRQGMVISTILKNNSLPKERFSVKSAHNGVTSD